jgi:hypothetical protein
MTKLTPTNGGKSTVNGLDIRSQIVVVFNMETLEILDTCENYTEADEKSCELYRGGIDARFDCLSFFDETLDAKKIIGLNLSQFQDFVDNNKHPLLN